MNLLVTGCAGFIASKVTELLLKRGHKVVGIDNLNDAYDVRLKDWRLRQLEEFENFTFYRLDITAHTQLEPLFEKSNFEAVMNLAARAGVRASTENPSLYLDTNIIGTLNLLELCRKYKIKKFILASTSSIYGEMSLPFTEDKKTDFPLSPYEALCYTYHYLYGIDISIPRYFTVYGPAGRPDMSVFIFSKKIYADEEIPVYGDGNQKRDTIKALKPLNYEIINLGSDHPVKLNYVISLIENALGKRARIKYLSRHPADVLATWADIEKAREILSWQPHTTLEEGIKTTVEWLLSNWEWAKKVKVG